MDIVNVLPFVSTNYTPTPITTGARCYDDGSENM